MVVVGHYWRSITDKTHEQSAVGEEDMFGESLDRMINNVICVDFSVGRRFKNRAAQKQHVNTGLAAFRLPELQLCFDHGLVVTVHK